MQLSLLLRRGKDSSCLATPRITSKTPEEYVIKSGNWLIRIQWFRIYLVSVDDAGFGSDLDGSIAQYPHRRLRIYFQEARSTVAQAILA
ncbi:hypothetical protein M747DRAFT_291412 [Aspergillus niger ATCC 13496]|uniref:Uncharacterized protein n=1 Tax=Aspergillus niger ATCC 13496 TaxID=1353008 RepID=A0A370CFS1_ASPNG|nr:hypothetical protein M747DRAFT_291412 [Aspergillus niger ATCC 13496]